MGYFIFVIFFLFSVNATTSPIPLSFKKTQPQVWDIKHNVFSQNDKIGNWRQKLKFNVKNKTFTLNNYSSHTENLGANKIEEFLIATSNTKLEPISYTYILKNNNKITKTITAQFYKKWKLTRLKQKSRKFTKKHKVQSFKNTNQLWIQAETTYHNNKTVTKKSFKKQIPSPVFLSSFLTLILSQKLIQGLKKTNPFAKLNTLTQKNFSFISFSEESLKLETGQAKLILKESNQSTWKTQYKNYSFNSTIDKKGKLIKTSMPLRQLRSQIINF